MVQLAMDTKLKNQLMIGNQLVFLVHFRIGQLIANTDWLCKSRANVRAGFLGVWAFFEAAKVSKWYLKVEVPGRWVWRRWKKKSLDAGGGPGKQNLAGSCS
jgi:hypothetical protein